MNYNLVLYYELYNNEFIEVKIHSLVLYVMKTYL